MDKTILLTQTKEILVNQPFPNLRFWTITGVKNLISITLITILSALLLFSLMIFLMAYWDLIAVTLFSGGTFGILNHYSLKHWG